MAGALSERDALRPAVGSLWRFEGPDSLVPGSRLLQSGRVNDIAVDPSHPNIVYLTGATGGLWKSFDSGHHWVSLSQKWRIQSATAVAVDPGNPSRVFVGTGEYRRPDHAEPFSVGVMKSSDGGLTWSERGRAEMEGLSVNRLVVDRAFPNRLFAATGHGCTISEGVLFLSTDGGETWCAARKPTGELLPQDVSWDDVAMNEGNVLWASANSIRNLHPPVGGGGLLFRSLDHGDSWEPVNLTIPGSFDLGNEQAESVQLAALAGLPNAIFVAVFRDNIARVFLVANDHSVAPREIVSTNPMVVGGGAWAHAAFAVAKSNVSGSLGRLYIGGDHAPPLLKGTIMQDLGVADLGYAGQAHEDLQRVVPDPGTQDGSIYFATDGGIYSLSGTTGTSAPLNATLGIAQIYRFDILARDPSHIAFGAQDLGTAASNPPGAGWKLLQTGDGRSAAFRQDNTDRVYVSNTYGRITRYDGLTTAEVVDRGTSQCPLVFRNDSLFFADRSSVHVVPKPEVSTTDDVLRAFSLRAGDASVRGIQALAGCPGSRAMYAGSNFGEMFLSDDGGFTWVKLDSLAQRLPEAPIWAIAASANNCHDVLVAMGYDSYRITGGEDAFLSGDRLFRNRDVTDPSQAWVPVRGVSPAVLPRAPLFAIVRHPSAPDTRWFVAGDVGVFATEDAGQHWSNATAPLGLPNTLVRDLRLSADGQRLYAATFGRGVWSLDLGPPSGQFGVRGLVTQSGVPAADIDIVATGPGHVKKRLTNLRGTGSGFTSSPINVSSSATISRAAAFIEGQNLGSVSLVALDGTTYPMGPTSPGAPSFSLTSAAAAALVGKATDGAWSFRVGATKSAPGIFPVPSIQQAFVDFEFTGNLTTRTTRSGEYTVEYLSSGLHTLRAPAFSFSTSVSLTSNVPNLNLALPSTGTFDLEPVVTRVAPGDHVHYALAYTLTNDRGWRELDNLQMRIGDQRGTAIRVQFDAAAGALSLIRESGAPGAAFAPGSPNRLETSDATLHLPGCGVTPNVPDHSSLTLTLEMSFKPSTAGRTFDVEILAEDRHGGRQLPAVAGRLEVVDDQKSAGTSEDRSKGVVEDDEEGEVTDSRIPRELSFAIDGARPSSDGAGFLLGIPSATHVEVAIYDVSGRRVAVPVNGELPAGYNAVRWEAQSCATGMYFAVLRSGGKRLVQRVVLLR